MATCMGNPDCRTLIEDLAQQVGKLDPRDCPAVLGALERLKALLWGRLLLVETTRITDSGASTPERLLTIPQVAALLAIPKGRAYELARHGALPVVRIGKYVRVAPTALQEWLDRDAKPCPGHRAIRHV
jgi:excisionase family DNA binding protein